MRVPIKMPSPTQIMMPSTLPIMKEANQLLAKLEFLVKSNFLERTGNFPFTLQRCFIVVAQYQRDVPIQLCPNIAHVFPRGFVSKITNAVSMALYWYNLV